MKLATLLLACVSVFAQTKAAIDKPALEAYLLDFTGDLYGKEVDAEFIAFLRPDQIFATPEALAAKMRDDCDRAQAVLAKIDADDPMRRFPLARALAKSI